MSGARHDTGCQSARHRDQPLVAAGAGIPAARAGDATHGILRKRGGDCAEAEEGSERKCEREFHDPSPLVQGIMIASGRIAPRNKPSRVRSVIETTTNRENTASSANSNKNT